MRVIAADSPLIKHELTIIRNKKTGDITFRKGLVKMGRYLSYELVKSFEVEEKEIETPPQLQRDIILKSLDKVLVINVLL
jgi:uracil phosphoribosyltransferase